MKQNLISEINNILTSKAIDKYQLIYCITKVRKYLEQNNKKGEYRFLNFYCNWALHPTLDKKRTTDLVLDYIWPSKELSDEHINFYFHTEFFTDLEKFCKNELGFDYNKKLTATIEEILNETFTDTPLVLIKEERYQYTLRVNGGVRYSHLKKLND